MCLGGGDDGASEQQAALAREQMALSKKLAQSSMPVPTRADESQRQTIIKTINQFQAMEGKSSTYLTGGGGAGDPGYR